MRIAVVCPYDPGVAGGVQQLTTELVTRLQDAGHDAWLVAPGSAERSVGRTVGISANASRAPIALSPSVARRVAVACDRADVVHVHEPVMPLVSLAAMRLDLPRVVTFHADAPRWVERLYATAGRVLDGPMRRSVVTAVSSVAARPIPSSWGSISMIPNAIDVGSYTADGARPAGRVVYLGRDDPRKGLDVVLAAWPSVRSENPEAELVVLGADRPTGPAGVRFLGWVDEGEKREWLASASVFVAPHTGGESFGLVLAEAMASGTPVVASDLPAFRQVLGDAGVMVPVGDVGALGRSVTEMLADPARRTRLGRAGRAEVVRFDWSAVLDGYLDAYRRAAGVIA